MDTDVEHAVELLSRAGRFLVFTGAGISTASGIPDFRGPEGLWTRLDPDDYTYERHMTDPAFRARTWERHLASPFLGAEPNPGHEAVTRLWDAGLTQGCVTQNVDGLHRRAGLDAEALVELHGDASRIACTACDRVEELEPVRRRWEAGETDPRCLACGGILKPAVVFFGEELPRAALMRASAMAERATGVLVVGSTLSVYPAADIAVSIALRGLPMIIVNRGPTDHDRLAAVLIDGDAAVVLPRLADALVDAAGPRAR